MNILVSGASGLIGSGLVPYLEEEGHNVIKLTRNEKQQGSIVWDSAQGIFNLPSSTTIDAVIHLAGENIAEGRWTKKKKERIRSSRIEGTSLISRRIAELDVKPEVMLSASGIGFYGSQGDNVLTEVDPPGDGFLVDVSRDWEAATFPAEEAGIRVVHMRIGPVLSTKGGAMKRMLPSFRFGLGATMGSGRQYMSWILIDDIVRAMGFLLSRRELSGPVNLCSPHPVTNREFARTLGKALKRPAVFRIPAVVLRILFGELSDELLSSTRARPDSLLKAGFEFRYPELDTGLRHLLSKQGI
ncbi:TIGR01777 family oxidoreductase [Chloroflexota bacterium]